MFRGFDLHSPYIFVQVALLFWLTWFLFAVSYNDYRQRKAPISRGQAAKILAEMEFNLEYHQAIRAMYQMALNKGLKTRLVSITVLATVGNIQHRQIGDNYCFFSNNGGFMTVIPAHHIQTR